MPRIDPHQLLKCLSVLLSPNGGIKSKDEVQRLASLMTKFSKKLVSKCIYVSILKATETDLLIMFMSAGGWDLTYSWLSDGVAAKNWPLVIELVDLLLVCPVDIDRLKTNACPKLIKTLSKNPSADEKVRLLACKLVEQWLRVVRGDVDNPASAQEKSTSYNDPQTHSQLTSVSETSSFTLSSDAEEKHNTQDPDNRLNNDKQCDNDGNVKVEPTESSDEHLPVYKITIRDGKKVLTEISSDRRQSSEVVEEDCSTGTEDINLEEDEDQIEPDEDEEEEVIKPVKVNKKSAKSKKQNIKKPAKVHSLAKKERDSSDSGSSCGKSPNRAKDVSKIDTKKAKADLSKTKSNAKNKNNDSSPKVKGTAIGSKELGEPTSLKPRDRFSLSLKNRKGMVSEKDKNKFDKTIDKEKTVFDSMDTLTDKEKETLSKFITPPISKVGKIPKKSSANKEEKQSEEKNRTLKDDKPDYKTDKIEVRKSIEVKKPEIKRPEKKYSISVEPKRSIANDSRPKTVKTYNSKFRSTGLEEDVKPPPPRLVPKKPSPSLPPVLPVPDKKFGKRSSPPPPEVNIPEKKLKAESPQEDKKPMEKVGGIKLIPPKPKPMFLQESDVFMDAMLAANTMKKPGKRKRRASTSKDSGLSEPKKENTGGNNSPMNSPKSEDASPSLIKPTFKFYQDTLDTSTEEVKTEIKMESESPDYAQTDQNSNEGSDDQKPAYLEDIRTAIKVEGVNSPLKGVLVHLKTKRAKKSVSWKEDELECIKYFELDETERVNVTKNFADMKSMEREHERENFQIARKLAVDDIMEERMRWKALIPIDIAAPVVAPGKNSQEKDIQYAREKTVSAAIYFNKRTIPDTAAEPDLEIHATTDPVSIPLDDITGSTDSINDFTTTPWPEPRGLPPAPAPAPPPPPTQLPPFQPPPGPGPFPQAPFPPMGPFMPGPGPGIPMPTPGDCWRTGDGKVVPIPPEMFPPQGMMPPGMPGMAPGPMMLPPDMPFPMAMPGPNPSPEEMAQFGGGFPPMGPSPPHQMFAPPPPPPPPQGPQGGNWQNAGNNNWYQGQQGGHDNDQPPPHHNQSNSGRYQNNNWRGGRGGGNRNPDGWGGGNNSRTPLCNNFIKRGFCRNNNCRFRHPR